jgi:hypothetical protein
MLQRLSIDVATIVYAYFTTVNKVGQDTLQTLSGEKP